MTARIGISGWTYELWRGVFYPKGLPHSQELAYASRQVRSIEINGSFYSLQRPTSYQKWFEATPDDFIFSVKAPRYITHMLRLKEPTQPLANFFASGVLLLAQKLGPVLWQLPPNFKFDLERLKRFLGLLPANTRAAARLARKHDDRLAGRSHTSTDPNRTIRYALEVRHESFRDERFFELLRQHDVALVVSHSSDAWPYFEVLTSEFIYARLHGEGELYSGSYEGLAMKRWEKKVRTWTSGRAPRDVFLYFDNDKKVRAPFDAMTLDRRLQASALSRSRSRSAA